MSAQYTPGHAKAGGNGIHIGVQCLATSHTDPKARRIQDARRIAACWNACEGLPTDALEKNPASLSQLLTQRDELLIALEHALAWNDDAQPEPAWVSEARAVIAKATGSAA